MNKRNFIAALIILFFIVPVQAQLLWKVTGKGLTKPSYLFGTHHLIEKEQIHDFDKILVLAGQADAVVGEMDMSNMLDMQLKMLKGVMMKDTTIGDLLGKEDYLLVENEFKQSMNMSLKTLQHMKPMMLNNMYTIMTYTRINKLKKQPEGVDILFQKRAKKEKKQVIGLETIEQQIDLLFNSIPLKRQAEMLVKGVKEKDKGIEELYKMNEAYLSGDLKKVEALNIDDDDMTLQERAMMIDNRNNNWIKKMTVLMPSKSCFIAVGCLHLVGESGLINQLRRAGYTVEGMDQI